jgi:hypothetical protein
MLHDKTDMDRPLRCSLHEHLTMTLEHVTAKVTRVMWQWNVSTTDSHILHTQITKMSHLEYSTDILLSFPLQFGRGISYHHISVKSPIYIVLKY